MMRVALLGALLLATGAASAPPGPAAAASPAGAPGAACDPKAAALAPPGGLSTAWVGKLAPQMLFFQALADFSYEQDFGTSMRRKSVGTCLEAWGATEWQRITVTSPLGADVHALALRTGADVIFVFRGMDSRRDLTFMDSQTTPSYDAAYFGGEAAAWDSAHNHTLADGSPNPEAFWALDGYTASYDSIHPSLAALLEKWQAAAGATKLRLWISGHSDGSQLAQLSALKFAGTVGADNIGGVIAFGPSRVGSVGFAKVFDSVLPGKFVYYAYGRDPASTTDYTMADGLMFPGVGLRACPMEGNATERLAVVPAGADREDVCSELTSTSTPLSRAQLPDWLLDTSDPSFDQLSSWEYLPHHIPAITYDGLMRLLLSGQGGAAAPDACQRAALELPQCVVSPHCSAALRPKDAVKCRGCASDATCTQYWGMPAAKCDRRFSELSGWQCWTHLPGTQLNLYFGRNGAPLEAAHLPQAPKLDLSRLGRKPPNPFSRHSHPVGK